MKKILLTSLALACAANAMAQDSTTMNFSTGTITAGNCSISAPFTLTVTGGNVAVSGGTFAGTCGGTTPPNTETVTITLTGTPFAIGVSTAAPTLTVGSSDTAVTCSVSGTDGTSYTATPGRAVTLGTPTGAGTTTYTPHCTTTAAGITTVIASPSSVSVLATQGQGGGGTTDCASNSPASSNVGGRTLTRQCSATNVSFGTYHPAYNGVLNNLTDVLADSKHPGPFPNLISGYTMRFPVTTGSYVALQFVATNKGQMQFNADGSFGNAGYISVSTRPGAFTVADGVVSGIYGACVYNYGFSNSLWMGMNGADCTLVQGNTYYVNFADIDSNGVSQCFNGSPGNCASSSVSYQVLSSQ